MKTETTVKTWEKTRLQNLVRHKSGRYYARLYRNGKEIWKSLKTSHYSVAETRLGALLKEHRQTKSKEVKIEDAKLTFQQAADLQMRRLEQDINLKSSTLKYWRQILKALLKSWDGLADIEIRRITPAACREWAAASAKKISATRYNNSRDFLIKVIAIGIEKGVIHSNAAETLDRKTVKAKKLELPTLEQFTAFIREVGITNSRFSSHCADLASGLAFTGCRLSEAARIKWKDISLEVGEIFIQGDPEEGTKNGETRRIPIIPEAGALFNRMRRERPDDQPDTEVFLVHECQKSMDRAAKKVGMARITHHDLRHFFATVCIEKGVDIPTVARWLGHKDGGVLAMKTYGHLRREHSIAQAQKVSFQPTTPPLGEKVAL